MELNAKAIKMGMINQCMGIRELSEATGISVHTLSKIINHGGKSRLTTIGKLAKALEVKPQEILLQE